MNQIPSHPVLATPEPVAHPYDPPTRTTPPTDARRRWWTPARLTAAACAVVSGLIVHWAVGSVLLARHVTGNCAQAPDAELCRTGIADWQLAELASRMPATALAALVAVIVPVCLLERNPRLAAGLAALGATVSVILAGTTILALTLGLASLERLADGVG